MTVLWVWIGVAVFTVVVFAFCAYELAWKSRRLSADLGGLAALQTELTGLGRALAVTRERLTAVRGADEGTGG